MTTVVERCKNENVNDFQTKVPTYITSIKYKVERDNARYAAE